LVSKRSHTAQVLISGSEKAASSLMMNYTQDLGEAFMKVLQHNNIFKNRKQNKTNGMANSSNSSGEPNSSPAKETVPTVVSILRAPSTEESEDTLLSFLLSEAQGSIRVNSKLSDLELSVHEIRPFDARQRFAPYPRLFIALTQFFYDFYLGSG
jgi:hypothetical protein